MKTYNKNDAINYADKWYDGNNPEYTWFGKSATGVASPIGGNGDCTNFVSQCLFAGGLTFKETGSATRQWYYYTKGGKYSKKSSSWSGANDLRIFVQYTQDAPRLNVTSVAWEDRTTGIKKGDLIFKLKSKASTEAAKKNIEAKHVAIVESVSESGEITVYQHTPYEHSVWEYAGNETVLYHINGIDEVNSSGNTEPTDSAIGKTGTVKVNSAGLNVRASANGSKLDYKLYNGEIVTILEVSSAGGYTWYRVKDSNNRQNGWVRSDFITLGSGTGTDTGSGSGTGTGTSTGYTSWQSKYGSNTFVTSNSYSGNVYRFQVDLNKWLSAKKKATIVEDGKWGSGSSAATLIFQQAFSDLGNDGKAGPATKAKCSACMVDFP